MWLQLLVSTPDAHTNISQRVKIKYNFHEGVWGRDQPTLDIAPPPNITKAMNLHERSDWSVETSFCVCFAKPSFTGAITLTSELWH